MRSKAGGRIGTDQRVPIIEALRDINVSLRQGARVGKGAGAGAGPGSEGRGPDPRRRNAVPEGMLGAS